MITLKEGSKCFSMSTRRTGHCKLNSNNENSNQSIYLPVTTMECMFAFGGYDNCYIFYVRKSCLVFSYVRFKEKRQTLQVS